MSNAAWIQLIAVLVAAACAVPGVFLVLRRVAMISDAISHSILFGIVVGFMIAGRLNSPLLFFGAVASGVLTVWLVEALIKSGRVAGDTAIGLVFPLLFSIGVVIVSAQFRDVHLDTHQVLLGELALAPLNTIRLGGANIPRGFVVMGLIAAANLGLVLLFFKELKLTTFDPALAAALGFAPGVIHYALMTAVSVTAVGAFDHVGAVLVIALMVAPPATAYLLTDRLEHMLLVSVGLGAAAAVGGYWAARLLQINIAGAIATCTGIIFLLTLAFAPQRGLLARRLEAVERRRRFAVDMLLVHLSAHEGSPNEAEENAVPHLTGQMGWSPQAAQTTLSRAEHQGLIARRGEALSLTESGRLAATSVLER